MRKTRLTPLIASRALSTVEHIRRRIDNDLRNIEDLADWGNPPMSTRHITRLVLTSSSYETIPMKTDKIAS